MYSIFAGLGLGVLLAIGCWLRFRPDALTAAAASVVSMVCALLVAYLLAIAVGDAAPMTQVITDTYELASMRSTEAINGTFVLGTGNIGQQQVYQVLLRHSDGSLTPYAVPGSATRIYEDDVDHGTLIVRRVQPDPTWRWNQWALYEHRLFSQNWEVHVPAGSVVHKFSAN